MMIVNKSVLLLGLILSLVSVPARGQDADAAAEVAAVEQLHPANSYQARSLAFYRQQMLDVFPADDYPEAYTVSAKRVIEEFCRLKQQKWLGLYLGTQTPALPDAERRQLCLDFVHSTDEHEPLAYLLASWMLAPANSKPLHGGVDPLLVRTIADNLMLGDYSAFVQCVGYAMVRHTLILSTEFGGGVPLAREKEKRTEEAILQHSRLMDVVFLALQEGMGEEVDQEILVMELVGLIEWDYQWNRDLIPQYFELYQSTVDSLDPGQAAYPWAVRVFKSGFHRDCYMMISQRMAPLDAGRRYLGRTAQEHYDAAYQLLEQAWEAHPDRPLAALSGLRLNPFHPNETDKWNRRGMDPNLPTISTIYRYYRTSVSPRRTGSIQGSLDYIFDIIDNERNGMILAEQVMWASSDLRVGTRSLDFVKAPGYYEQLAVFCQKMIDAQYDSEPDDSWYELWAVVAMLTDRREVAMEIFRAHGDDFGGGPTYMFFNKSWSDFEPLFAGAAPAEQ